MPREGDVLIVLIGWTLISLVAWSLACAYFC